MQRKQSSETDPLAYLAESKIDDSIEVLQGNTAIYESEKNQQQITYLDVLVDDSIASYETCTEQDIVETKDQKYAAVALLVAKISAKLCAAVICAGATASLAFAVQNEEDKHLFIGLQQNSDELDFSGYVGCDILKDESALSKGEMSAKKITSAAYKNNFGGMISTEPIEQYYNFFENLHESYRSSITGIEYRLYLYDQNESSAVDITNLALIEQIEMSIFKDSNYSDHPTTRSKIACMRTDIIDNKSMNGRVIPLVVPANPACIKDLKITYEIDDCNQIGFTMPLADFDIGLWDLNPIYDEFILLTTGNNLSEIPNELIGHELIHKFYEGFRGGEYELNLPAEEKFAKFAGDQLSNDIIFEALSPMIVYAQLD